MTIQCADCDKQIRMCCYDDAGWEEWRDEDLCPSCMEARRRKAKDGIEKCMPPWCHIGLWDWEGKVLRVIIEQDESRCLDDVLDILEAIRLKADSLGVWVLLSEIKRRKGDG